MSTRIPANVLATTYSFREVAEDIEAILKEHEGEVVWAGGTYSYFTGVAPLALTEDMAPAYQGWAGRIVEKWGDDIADAPCVAILTAPVSEALTEVWGAARKLGLT